MFNILKPKKNKKIYRTHTFDPIDYENLQKCVEVDTSIFLPHFN